MPFTLSDPLRRYGVAVLAVVLAVGLRLLLDPLLGDAHAFVTLYLAVVFVAWACGFGPALLTILLGAASATYFVLPPRGSIAIHRLEDQVGLVLFVLFGLVTAALGKQVRKGRVRIDRERQRLVAEVEERSGPNRACASWPRPGPSSPPRSTTRRRWPPRPGWWCRAWPTGAASTYPATMGDRANWWWPTWTPPRWSGRVS